jgi:RNA polymerase sigma factor (sigma-70 family)
VSLEARDLRDLAASPPWIAELETEHMDKTQHPFADLEDHFQTLVSAWRSELAWNSPSAIEAFNLVSERGVELVTASWNGARLRRSGTEPSDIVQDWFVVLWARGFERYDPARRFFPFAYELLKHVLIDHYRRVSRRRESELKCDLFDARSNPVRSAQRNELKAGVWASMPRLAPELRHAVELHFWEPSRKQGTASRGAMGSRRFRAYEKLRKILKQFDAD